MRFQDSSKRQHFNSLEEMIVAVSEIVRPPERLTVSQAAAKYRKLNNPGAYVGDWLNEMAPYMAEPMDELTSFEFTGLIFAGPAQSAKTDALILNWISYTAICDPADMMVIQTAQSVARDFARRRIDRLYRHSPEVGDRVLPGRHNQNTYDTRFKSGMLLTLSWPTINELSGRPIPRLALTDYDRMPPDVDHEGAPFDLAKKRATTFRRYGMTVAESSPGYEIENPKWISKSAHEAPPTQGILSLYNRGDRRRWYWRCIHCKRPFEPDFHLLRWPETKDALEAAEVAYLVCPHCDGRMQHQDKYHLNLSGRWIKDGQVWLPDGTIKGRGERSDIASFWLKGVAASFADWRTLVFNFIKASEECEITGDESALKTTVNTDQGNPYTPKSMDGDRLPEELKQRSFDFGEKIVPVDVRFLVASIDIQKNRFVVQVHGFASGGEIWIVDRFAIKKSERLDEDGERYLVSPGGYEEDWRLLIDGVIQKSYPLDEESERRMQIKMVFCDSGGRAGVTTNAYNFWRYLRDEAEGNLHRRFQLVKGAAMKSAPRVQISYPDSERKDRHAGARGEIPILMLNTDMIKDQCSKMLDRMQAAEDTTVFSRINFPAWLPDWFYNEMTAETRTAKGWENPKKLRNEAWDLLVYAVAGALSRHINIERIDWANPPGWAADWEANDLVFGQGQPGRFQEGAKPSISLTELGENLA